MRVGIIGVGNMGSAILSGIAQEYEVYAFDIAKDKIKDLSKIYTFNITGSEKEVVKKSDYIILAIKPDKVKDVVFKVKESLNPEKCIISIAAGVSIGEIKEWSESKCPIIRVMPNTCVLVKKGVFGVCFDSFAKEVQKEFVLELFKKLGRVYEIEEKDFDAFTSLVGCGPAYLFYFIEALIEAGITVGFTKEIAQNFVFDLIEGSLILAQKSSLPISELKYMVTSPKGATIYALNLLNRRSTKANVIDAVLSAYKRCKELKK